MSLHSLLTISLIIIEWSFVYCWVPLQNVIHVSRSYSKTILNRPLFKETSWWWLKLTFFFVNYFHKIKRLGRKMIMAKFLCIRLHRNVEKKIRNFNVPEKTKITWSAWNALQYTFNYCHVIFFNIDLWDVPLFWIRSSCSFLGQSLFFRKSVKNLGLLHDCLWNAWVIVEGGANNIYALGQQEIIYFYP